MRLLLLAAGLGLTLLYVPVPGADTHRLFQEIWNQGHVILFAVLTLLGLRWRLLPQRLLKRVLWQLLPVLITLALVSEGLQVLTPHRNASLADAAHNLLGLTLGLALSPHLQQRLPAHWRGLPQVLALPVLAWLILPLWLVLADSLHSRQQFPQLLSMAQPTEMSRISTQLPDPRRLPVPGEPGGHVLAVTLPGSGGGLALRHLQPDWRGCQSLALRLWAEQPMALQLRLHDRDHDWRYQDRYNQSLSLLAGWQTLTFSLKDIAAAPAGRTLQLNRIQELALFSRDTGHDLSFKLSEVRLEGEGCG